MSHVKEEDVSKNKIKIGVIGSYLALEPEPFDETIDFRAIFLEKVRLQRAASGEPTPLAF